MDAVILRKLYIEEGLTCEQIAQKLNLSKSNIKAKLKKFDIPRRTGSPVKHRIDETLLKSYISSGRSVQFLANEFKCNAATIRRRLKEFNINLPNTDDKRKSFSKHLKSGKELSLSQKIRLLPEYKKWRLEILTRDGFKCTICQSFSNLEVDHHPWPFGIILILAAISSVEEALKHYFLWQPEIGRTLCVICHRKTNNYGKKAMSKKIIKRKCQKCNSVTSAILEPNENLESGQLEVCNVCKSRFEYPLETINYSQGKKILQG